MKRIKNTLIAVAAVVAIPVALTGCEGKKSDVTTEPPVKTEKVKKAEHPEHPKKAEEAKKAEHPEHPKKAEHPEHPKKSEHPEHPQ